jgi:hypothetical protein
MDRAIEQEFIRAAFNLSRSDHAAWKEFTTAYAKYAQQACVEAVRAPTENALTAHGRAQAFLALEELFQELDSRMASITKQKDSAGRAR